MRDTKFRAWDGKYRQMLYGGEYWERYPIWYPVDFITNKGVAIWNKLSKGSSENSWESLHLKINPDMILMQFTGLFDKNGKAIYEGDILAVDWGGIPEDYAHDTIIMEFRNYGWFPFTHALPMPRNIEVTGNIYENPELLK